MTPADEYRTKAMEFAAKAQRELDRLCRLQYEMLAQSYLRLATQAEQNSRADLVYETPVGSAREQQQRPAAAQQQQQQQQQAQPDKPSPDKPTEF